MVDIYELLGELFIDEEIDLNDYEEMVYLITEILDTYIEKNTKYGNSFGDTFDKVGIISAYTRISDKFNRFEYMVMNKDNGTDDERMRDTLLDMANYCLMTVMELEKENE